MCKKVNKKIDEKYFKFFIKKAHKRVKNKIRYFITNVYYSYKYIAIKQNHICVLIIDKYTSYTQKCTLSV